MATAQLGRRYAALANLATAEFPSADGLPPAFLHILQAAMDNKDQGVITPDKTIYGDPTINQAVVVIVDQLTDTDVTSVLAWLSAVVGYVTSTNPKLFAAANVSAEVVKHAAKAQRISYTTTAQKLDSHTTNLRAMAIQLFQLIEERNFFARQTIGDLPDGYTRAKLITAMAIALQIIQETASRASDRPIKTERDAVDAFLRNFMLLLRPAGEVSAALEAVSNLLPYRNSPETQTPRPNMALAPTAVIGALSRVIVNATTGVIPFSPVAPQQLPLSTPLTMMPTDLDRDAGKPIKALSEDVVTPMHIAIPQGAASVSVYSAAHNAHGEFTVADVWRVIGESFADDQGAIRGPKDLAGSEDDWKKTAKAIHYYGDRGNADFPVHGDAPGVAKIHGLLAGKLESMATKEELKAMSDLQEWVRRENTILENSKEGLNEENNKRNDTAAFWVHLAEKGTDAHLEIGGRGSYAALRALSLMAGGFTTEYAPSGNTPEDPTAKKGRLAANELTLERNAQIQKARQLLPAFESLSTKVSGLLGVPIDHARFFQMCFPGIPLYFTLGTGDAEDSADGADLVKLLRGDPAQVAAIKEALEYLADGNKATLASGSRFGAVNTMLKGLLDKKGVLLTAADFVLSGLTEPALKANAAFTALILHLGIKKTEINGRLEELLTKHPSFQVQPLDEAGWMEITGKIIGFPSSRTTMAAIKTISEMLETAYGTYLHAKGAQNATVPTNKGLPKFTGIYLRSLQAIESAYASSSFKNITDGAKVLILPPPFNWNQASAALNLVHGGTTAGLLLYRAAFKHPGYLSVAAVLKEAQHSALNNKGTPMINEGEIPIDKTFKAQADQLASKFPNLGPTFTHAKGISNNNPFLAGAFRTYLLIPGTIDHFAVLHRNGLGLVNPGLFCMLSFNGPTMVAIRSGGQDLKLYTTPDIKNGPAVNPAANNNSHETTSFALSPLVPVTPSTTAWPPVLPSGKFMGDELTLNPIPKGGFWSHVKNAQGDEHRFSGFYPLLFLDAEAKNGNGPLSLVGAPHSPYVYSAKQEPSSFDPKIDYNFGPHLAAAMGLTEQYMPRKTKNPYENANGIVTFNLMSSPVGKFTVTKYDGSVMVVLTPSSIFPRPEHWDIGGNEFRKFPVVGMSSLN